ncbi:MAG: anti-sigma factor family protein [Vicinamibacterales bacterium]
MILWGCASIRRRLPAFHDRELPIRDLITIESHVTGCPACAGELQELRSVGDALRLAAVPAPADHWTGLRSGVVSRMRAEAHESWTARTERMFDDLHLIWIGLAATVATLLCGAVALSAVQFASPERDDSLAAMISVISAPAGSNLNPVRADNRFLQFPSVPGSGPIEAMLAQPVSRDELTLALSAVVTREGRVSGLSVLTTEQHPQNLDAILDVLSRGRLEPGRRGTLPVAVNLVWLVAHTTVKAKAPPRTI